MAPRETPTRLRRLIGALPFIAVHLGALAALWIGAGPVEWAVCAGLFFLRMFGITAGYHRYFSHRSFETSRPMQLLLAVLAQTSSQKGVLWWGAHHRVHHRWSDTERDPHSPVVSTFWQSHVGWLFDGHHDRTLTHKIRDFARFPELRWLDRFWWMPPVALGLAVYLVLGLPGLVVGFFLSTVLTWHVTFFINSLAHVVGTRRYATSDDSRNSWWLAVLTLGEGWHNNHHHYMHSCRQGFRWWEIDVTYYILRAMAAVGLVWNLKEPPAEVVAGAPTPRPRKTRRPPEGRDRSLDAAA